MCQRELYSETRPHPWRSWSRLKTQDSTLYWVLLCVLCMKYLDRVGHNAIFFCKLMTYITNGKTLVDHSSQHPKEYRSSKSIVATYNEIQAWKSGMVHVANPMDTLRHLFSRIIVIDEWYGHVSQHLLRSRFGRLLL